MSDGISYVDCSWNPLAMRCSRVSPGCDHCWHVRMCKRHAMNMHFSEAERMAYAGGKPVMREHILQQPLHWRKPRRVALQFMGDWMHPDVSLAFIDSMLEVIAACPQHLFLTLTKRPELLEEKLYGVTPECACRELGGGDYLPNVMLGVTVEDQQRADERMPDLMKLAAMGWRTWVSYEPAIGPVDWEPWLGSEICDGCGRIIDYLRLGQYHELPNGLVGDPPELCGRIIRRPGIDWLVCGGETGPGARPMHLAWARQARDQCAAAGVPFFLKSLGRWEFGINGIPTKRLGREKASRLLDGVEHNGLPGKE